MTPPSKFINHVLRDVDPAKYGLTADMWGSNGWEVVSVIPDGERWTVFLKREIRIADEPRD